MTNAGCTAMHTPSAMVLCLYLVYQNKRIIMLVFFSKQGYNRHILHCSIIFRNRLFLCGIAEDGTTTTVFTTFDNIFIFTKKSNIFKHSIFSSVM